MIISLGYFYLNAAHNEVYSFYQASIVARFTGLVGFIGLATFKMAKPRRIFVEIIDAFGAIWTLLTLTN